MTTSTEVAARRTAPVRQFFANARPVKKRPFQVFAEKELILPTGPRAGLPFRVKFMPWTGLVLEAFSAGRYRRFFGSGPVQCSKTLLFFVIPLLYHLFEVEETVILAVPRIETGQGIYEERLLPAIMKSRYRRLLPTRGVGSKGGRALAIRYQNGATLRFMGAGGGDDQRSTFTSRVVVITEIDKMDKPGAVSREADPVRQFEARTRAFGSRAVVYGECTMSNEDGRIYQEVCQYGTETRIYIPCEHCGAFVAPERENFGGWQGAADIMEAQAEAHFICPECGGAWSESDRRQSLGRPALAARGQKVTKAGATVGKPPRTFTFGIRWNAMHSALTEMSDIAEVEFRADQSDQAEAMKEVMQFIWAQPYRDQMLNLSSFGRDIVLQKVTNNPRGVVPAECTKLTVFIDLGLYWCWWSAWGWTEKAEGHLIDYGALEVPQEREANTLAILTVLRAFRTSTLVPGWQQGGNPRVHDLCLVDMSYGKDVAYTFVRESGQGRYFASQGLGTTRKQGNWRPPRAPKKGDKRVLGHEWFITLQANGIRLVNMHSDYWKRQVHEGFVAAAGTPGSLQLYQAQPRDHQSYARQIAAERQLEEFKPGKGTIAFWDQVSAKNHYLDCAYGCRCAADMLGIRLMKDGKPKTKRRRRGGPAQGQRRIRTNY